VPEDTNYVVALHAEIVIEFVGGMLARMTDPYMDITIVNIFSM
jgi:hypothetical protein